MTPQLTRRGGLAVQTDFHSAARLFDAVSPTQVRESGVCLIEVAGQVVITPHWPVPSLEYVWFLREATSAGLAVAWRGVVNTAIDSRLLSHLPQPGSAGQTVRCYYRLGPGCVQVTDERQDKASQCTLRGAEAHVFGDLLQPRLVAGLGAADSAAYSRLAARRLVLELGGYALALPHRLTCRPVPWNVF